MRVIASVEEAYTQIVQWEGELLLLTAIAHNGESHAVVVDKPYVDHGKMRGKNTSHGAKDAIIDVAEANFRKPS